MTMPTAEPLFASTPAPEPVQTAPEPTEMAEPADDSAHVTAGSTGGFGDSAEDDWDEISDDEAGEPLELSLEAEGDSPTEDGQSGEGDELLLDASRLAEDDAPVSSPLMGRRRGLVSSGSDPLAEKSPRLPTAGNTLFERMANLSRGGRTSDAEDEEGEEGDDSPAISIPRFLGRQNNQ